MNHYDIFNGDADGICALIQLRLAKPQNSTLITGVKRDIELVQQVANGENARLTVLDISLKKNIKAIQHLLKQGADIFYADHHQAGDIPQHPKFSAQIQTDANVCTSLIINHYLKQRYPLWAITAAFGDNLTNVATELAAQQPLNTSDIKHLQQLGTYLNYNGYGSQLEDLHFTPDYLYQQMVAYESPLDFLQAQGDIFQQLAQGYQDDMRQVQHIKPIHQNTFAAVYLLDDAAWSRRVSGVFANQLVHQHPNRAHAILTHHPKSGYQVSVRAAKNNPQHAEQLCAKFPTGGGRTAAAGINHLPSEQLDYFIQLLSEQYTTCYF